MIDTELKIDILSNLCIDMHQGINTVTEKIEYLESGVPILQSKHITKGYLNIEDTKYVSEKDYEKYRKKYQAKINDVLVCNIGTIGKSLVIRNEENFLIAWNLFLIKLDKNKLDSNYFQHYLNYLSQKKYFDKFLTGGTVKFINKKTMGNIPIPLPPIETQKLIAQILDDAAALRDKTHQLIKEYDALAQSIFLDMFGDPVRNEKCWMLENLKKITSKIGSGSTPSGGKDAYHEEGISLIRSLNIHDNFFKMKDLAFIDEKQANKLKNVSLEKNDVLINITGASVARSTIVPDELLPARVNQHVSILRPKFSILNSVFLLHLLISPNSKVKLLGVSSQGGATREAITKDQLENFEIILPSIALQKKFAEKITLIEQQKELAKQELKESEDLFNCLLQKAFKGELV